jgi:hypothetical protein
MLVHFLSKLFGYQPTAEYISIDNNTKKLPYKHLTDSPYGMFDVLGEYYSTSNTIVIYEKEIEKCMNNYFSSQNNNNGLTRDTLRQLIRLHEHSHSIIKTCMFDTVFDVVSRMDIHQKNPVAFSIDKINYMNYNKKPKDVIESLTQFVVFSIVERTRIDPYVNMFKLMDDVSPHYYRRWRDLVRYIEEKYDMYEYHFFIPPLVKIFRENAFSNFAEFMEVIENNLEIVDAWVKYFYSNVEVISQNHSPYWGKNIMYDILSEELELDPNELTFIESQNPRDRPLLKGLYSNDVSRFTDVIYDIRKAYRTYPGEADYIIGYDELEDFVGYLRGIPNLVLKRGWQEALHLSISGKYIPNKSRTAVDNIIMKHFSGYQPDLRKNKSS